MYLLVTARKGISSLTSLSALFEQALVEARLEEAGNWHQFGQPGHDPDGWCCKREDELRNELALLRAAAEK